MFELLTFDTSDSDSLKLSSDSTSRSPWRSVFLFAMNSSASFASVSWSKRSLTVRRLFFIFGAWRNVLLVWLYGLGTELDSRARVEPFANIAIFFDIFGPVAPLIWLRTFLVVRGFCVFEYSAMSLRLILAKRAAFLNVLTLPISLSSSLERTLLSWWWSNCSDSSYS